VSSSSGSLAARPAPALPRRSAREWAGRGRELARRHWLFVLVAACATALRVVVLLAYQQALIFPDSERYLQYARSFINGMWTPDWLRTSGYSLLLMPAVLAHNLAVVAAIQHLLGLATGALIYALLVRFGARRWLAVLATIPVLFDPLQLVIEQYILTDVSATFLLVVALVVLVWKRDAIGKAAPVAVGLLIAAATVIRESDLLVAIPALLYLAVVLRRRRRRAIRAGLLLLLGLLPPVLGYLGWMQVWYGSVNFVTYSNEFMYGRIAQFADCTGLSLPSYEVHLCPPHQAAAADPNFYMWDPLSPQVTLAPADGLSKSQIVGDFNTAIIEHQPLAYVKAVAGDVIYSFSPVRGNGPEHYPVTYTKFQTYFPADPGEAATLRSYTGSGPRIQPQLADFLNGYGRFFYIPGPLLAAGLLLGVAGLAGVGRARRSGLRAECLLFTTAVIAAIVPPFFIATFDWRYELPQLSLIPVAAVFGVLALTGQPAVRPGPDGGESDEMTSAGPPMERATPPLARPAADCGPPEAGCVQVSGLAGQRLGGSG